MLKPSKIETTFEYECPECGGINWFTLKQVQNYTFFICDVCDVEQEINRVKSVVVNYVGDVKNKQKKDLKEKLREEKDANVVNYINMLCRMGYSRGDARHKVETILSCVDYDLDSMGEEEFVKLLLES